ncbi:hypothetical protein HX021_14170 [Sphingobacterium sp. N143]|uniref:hypothetical protein n=1 Tax=Sphingobacterium sp. N143 TaxID=2746727 RepID=UPI0025790C3A|nr:hypothetical protein [Sphingobacterium sp. N143]MDM1295431.1 hypothetical protein [Sphingobacterium sp. N143]
MRTLSNVIWIFMLSLVCHGHIIAQDNNVNEQIWRSVGGQDKWDSLQYLAYSAKGNVTSEQLSNEERKFLFNRTTGECRFDGYSGANQVTYLFNFKNNGPDKLFIGGSITNDEQELKKSIRSQLFADLNLLLLPTLIEQKNIQLKDQEEQFIGGQKLTIASITSSSPIFGSKLDGLLYIDQNTGEITRYEYTDKTEKVSYEVSKYKEIGDGIRLPSFFSAANNAKRTCIFSSISSFVQVEQKKFKEL